MMNELESFWTQLSGVSPELSSTGFALALIAAGVFFLKKRPAPKTGGKKK